MKQEFQELYSYNRWANERVLVAAGELTSEELVRDLGSSFPSVMATLSHMLFAEWIWLERWMGNSPKDAPSGWRTSALTELRGFWRDFEQRQSGFIDDLSEERLQQIVEYRNTAGTSLSAPLHQLMRHVVNHSTYHRGQVATMLRQLGSKAPGTDLVLFYRESSSGSRSR